jgi:hypothetical protein
MPKNAESDARYYAERTKNYTDKIAELLKLEADTLDAGRKDPANAALRLFELSGKMCDLASNYMALNRVSIAVLENRNEEALEEARKSIYKALIYAENIVTAKIDAPYSEYQKNLAELSGADEKRRYTLVRKIGLAVTLLETAYGSNSKWKWSFVDIEGRTAVVAKNLMELDKAVKNVQPGGTDQEVWTAHYRMITQLLEMGSGRFLQRYQLATHKGEDLRMACSMLGALKYIYETFGDRNSAQQVWKKLEVMVNRFDHIPVAER